MKRALVVLLLTACGTTITVPDVQGPPAILCECKAVCGHADGTVGELLPRPVIVVGYSLTESAEDRATEICNAWMSQAECVSSACTCSECEILPETDN